MDTVALVIVVLFIFLGNFRAALITALNIPLALTGSVVALALTGQTINLMTLGGLALSIGILVDMSTVEVENIHTHLGEAPSVARAALRSNLETAVRRTFAAIPDPRVVIAVGACAASGGIVGKGYASAGGVDRVLPVDVYIPGCPPRPEAIIFGILVAVGRLSARRLAREG